MNLKSISAPLKKNAMLVALIVVYLGFILFTLFDATPDNNIFSPANTAELINQNAYVFILGTGMMMCMLTGGNIDLSCGAFVCLLGAIGGVLMSPPSGSDGPNPNTLGLSAPVSIALMLLIGLCYGVLLGYLIAYVHIPPWIATLVGYLAFRGLGTQILAVYSKTQSLANFPSDFRDLFYGKLFSTPQDVLNIPCFILGLAAAAGVVWSIFNTRRKRLAKGYEADTVKSAAIKSGISAVAIIYLMTLLSFSGGIPTVLLWVAGIVLIYSFITSKTTIGRHFYVVGGNKEAARLSGVNTRRIMFLAYLNMAFLTSIVTMVVMSRNTNTYADVGKNFEMDAISACVVGGVSASGGAGTVLGMVIGATLIGVINMGMSLVKLDIDIQKVVKGLVLLGAVVFDILSKKKNK